MSWFRRTPPPAPPPDWHACRAQVLDYLRHYAATTRAEAMRVSGDTRAIMFSNVGAIEAAADAIAKMQPGDKP
jgi:hypothetical protein